MFITRIPFRIPWFFYGRLFLIQSSASANLWARMITIENDGLWNQHEIYRSVFEMMLQLVRLQSYEKFKYHNEKGETIRWKNSSTEKQAKRIRRGVSRLTEQQNKRQKKEQHKETASVE